MYNVLMSRRVSRAVSVMPKKQQEKLVHHCHLSHKWVACWVETEKGITVEVTYAGSRGSAPYAEH